MWIRIMWISSEVRFLCIYIYIYIYRERERERERGDNADMDWISIKIILNPRILRSKLN